MWTPELPSDVEDEVTVEQDEEAVLPLLAAEEETDAPADVPLEDADTAANAAMTDDIADLFELDADEEEVPAAGQASSEDHTEQAPDVERAEAEDEVAETIAAQDAAPVEEDAPAAVEQTDEPRPFVFNAGARASRFVWKIDAEGRFSSISHEFAEAVGAKAAAVEGMSFADVAALFNLDPEGKIRELLGRRDTVWQDDLLAG